MPAGPPDKTIPGALMPSSAPAERMLDEGERRAMAAVGRGEDARSTDIASGGGIPAWIASTLKYCSRCGNALACGPLPGEIRDRLSCTGCGHIAYANPRLVVCTLPTTEAREVVLVRRGIHPGYDQWAQPGGYLESDETVGEAAMRETCEETGFIVEPGRIIGLYSRLEAAVVVLVFEARIVGGEARTSSETLEVRAFAANAIPWQNLAFKTTFCALCDWLSLLHPTSRVPRRSAGATATDPRST